MIHSQSEKLEEFNIMLVLGIPFGQNFVASDDSYR
jgi:hypothetical protein